MLGSDGLPKPEKVQFELTVLDSLKPMKEIFMTGTDGEPVGIMVEARRRRRNQPTTKLFPIEMDDDIPEIVGIRVLDDPRNFRNAKIINSRLINKKN